MPTITRNIAVDWGGDANAGTAQAGGASTITLASAASAVDAAYAGRQIVTTGGTGAGQVRTISGYVGSTRVATVGVAWTVAPDDTTMYAVGVALGVTVKDASRATLIARATTGFVLDGANGQWLLAIPNWDTTWGAYVTIDDGAGTSEAAWLEPGQTGDAFARLGAAGAGLTAIGDTRIAHLDADVSSRSTYAGADTSGTTTLLSRVAGAVPLATDYTTSRAAKLDNLDAAVSTRSTFAGGAVASVTGNVGGNVTGSVGSVATGGIAAASFASGAVDATAFAQGAADKVWGTTTRQLAGAQAFNLTGNVTGNLSGSVGSVTGNVGGSVASVAAAIVLPTGTGAGQVNLSGGAVTLQSGQVVTAGTVSDKTGYALTAAYDPAKAAAQAGDAMTLTSGERTTLAASIWNALTSGMTTVGSVGKRIVDYLTGDAFARLGAPAGASIAADIATRLPTSGYTAPDNADVVTALSDLVTLLARTDPTTALVAVKTVTDKLATMLAASGSNSTYTADALKNSPAASAVVISPSTAEPPYGSSDRESDA